MLTIVGNENGTDTKHEGFKNVPLQHVRRLSSSSLSSVFMPFRALGSPSATFRTTRTVLEDIFFTYIGCPTTNDFFLLQKDGRELQRRIKQGWNIPNMALEPVIPERLLAWHTSITNKRQLIHEDTLCTTLLNFTTQCYPKNTFVRDEKDQRLLLSLLLPPLEGLPVPTRCNIEAINAIRDLVGQHLRHLLGLVDAVLNLKGRWGRLDERERSHLHGVMKSVTATRVKGLAALQKGFVELNFSKLGLFAVSAEIVNYTEVRVLQLSNNRGLKHLPVVPPACQTVLASACSLETIASMPRLIGPPTEPIFSRVLVMGLSYNCLTSIVFTRCFPSLRVLDITGNRLASLDDIVASLQEHTALVDIYLAENPVSLLDGYRHFVVKACPRLVLLDGQRIRSEERKRKASLPADVIAAVSQPSIKQRPSPKKSKKSSNLFVALSPMRSSLLTRSQSDAFLNTVFVSVEIVALRQISALSHTPLTVTSVDELLPTHSDVWQQIANVVPCFDPSPTRDPSQGDQYTLAELWALHSLPLRPGSTKSTHHAVPLYTHTSSLSLKGGWGPIVDSVNNAEYYVPIVLMGVELTTNFPTNGSTSRGTGSERSGGKISPSAANMYQMRKTEGQAMTSGSAVTRGKGPVPMLAKDSGDMYRPPPDHATFTRDIPISEELSERLARAIRLHVEVHDTIELSIVNGIRTLSRGSRRESGSRTSVEFQSSRRQNLDNLKIPSIHTTHVERSIEQSKSTVETHVYQLGDIFLQPRPLLALPSTSFYCSQLILMGRLLLSEADRQAELKFLREEQDALRKALEAYSRAFEAASMISPETSALMDKDNLNRPELTMQNPQCMVVSPSSSRQGYHNKISSPNHASHSEMGKYLQRVLLCGARVVAQITRLQELYKAANRLEVEVKLCLGRGPINPSLQEVAPRKAKGINKHSSRAK